MEEFKIEPLSIQNPNIESPMPIKRSFWNLKNFMNLKYLFFVAVTVLAVALVIFFFTRGSFSDGGVDFKIEAPSEISAGQLIEYKITYKNNNKASVDGVHLSFFYPADAIALKDDSAANLTNESFEIGTLKSGQSEEKIIKAFLVGDLGNIKTARAVLVFTPSNSKTEYKKEFSLASTINSLAVLITLVAPPTVTNNQTTTYLIDYRNQSGEEIKNLRFKLTYPSGFSFKNSSPNPTSSTGTFSRQDSWDIESLKDGDSKRITIQGVLSGQEREAKKASLLLQKKITLANGTDVYVDFEKTEATSTITSSMLYLSMKLNGETDYIAHLGDKLSYTLNFGNNTNQSLSGLNLSVKLTGSMFDFTTVETDGFFDSRTNIISWDGSANPLLGDLGPNRSGSAFFKVKLKSNYSGASGAKDSFVKAAATIETTNVPIEIDSDKISASSDITTRLSSSPTFSQKLLINEMALSPNQFPPKVNKKTSFVVRWLLTNPGNPLSSAKITANLAPGVSWIGNTETSGSATNAPTFDSKRGIITWNIGNINSGTGDSPIQYQASFQISITPSVNQVGQAIDLLKNLIFNSTDAFTNEEISRTIRDINSDDTDDSQESGIVVQ